MSPAWQSPEALRRENVQEPNVSGQDTVGPTGESWGRSGHFIGIGVAWSTATAVTLFSGEPSTTRSEYVR